MSQTHFHPAPTEDQAMILDLVSGFAKEELGPQGEAIDHDGVLPEALEEQLAEMGLLAIPISEGNGGAGFDFTSYALSLVELAKASATTAMHIVNQTNLFLEPMSEHAAGHQAFIDVASGTCRGALALNEDASSWLESSIQMDCSGMVLNGSKKWVEGAASANWLIVAAKDTDGLSFFVVDAARPGINIANGPSRLGFRTIPATDVTFSNVKVEEGDRLGPANGGGEILARIRRHGMTAATAVACGIMAAARDSAALYATERKQFRRAIANFEAIRQRLSSSEMGYGTGINMLLSCARMIDAGEDCTSLARIAKVVSSQNAVKATDDALQVYGGYGVSQEYPAERFYRDACCLGGLFGGNDGISQEIAVSILPAD
ncbi:MAG: alkylation response protein AidB-like acyl-CoA dehydrogenase [Planctomycetota bacterium]|jgi:alkylation response protein AidB-like acyl-CoA dehydrogenase